MVTAVAGVKGWTVRMAELATATDVPVATVKFYLREGLLPGGRPTAVTRAEYDESHVRRLRLIRALVHGAGLNLTAVRTLLAAVDDPPPSMHALLGVAHDAVARPVDDDVDLADAQELLRRWGWAAAGHHPATTAALAASLRAVSAAGLALPATLLDRYAEAMLMVAEEEIAGVPTGSPEDAVRYVALGTVLVEPLLLAVRRLAEQTASARRFAEDEAPDGGREG